MNKNEDCKIEGNKVILPDMTGKSKSYKQSILEKALYLHRKIFEDKTRHCELTRTC